MTANLSVCMSVMNYYTILLPKFDLAILLKQTEKRELLIL